MRQPKGYETPGKEHQVCCLNHVIYGLKQSRREWYETLTAVMYKFNFTRCETEHAVFHRYTGQDALIVTVDVDDLTIAGNSKESIQRFKNELKTTFKIKDLGDLHWLLGIEVKRDRESRTISFSQCAYIERILERFNLQDANPLSTPLDPYHKLSLAQSPSTSRHYEAMCGVPYREAIGSLMYVAQGTRPDISFMVSFLAQFMQNPGRPHWEAVKRVFRYLKGTKGMSRHWWIAKGPGGILGSRLGITGAPSLYLWVCLHDRWRHDLMELEETTDCCTIYDRS
jgi:Reverse transcriptase (RNA-dependent DNA polymerase)